MSFEAWWEVNKVVLPGQPAVMVEAFKEVARKAWDAAYQEGWFEGETSGREAEYYAQTGEHEK